MDFNLSENLDVSEFTLRILLELLIVLGIGVIVGLEREYSAAKDAEINEKTGSELFAGVRTFPIVALIGYLSIFLSNEVSSWIFPVALLVVSAFSVTAYYISNLKNKDGSTTEFALIAVFLLSSLVYMGEYLLSAFIALLITVLLTFKVKIHRAVARLSRQEILSILLFAAITALVLPLLPNQDFGPYGALNPYKIWFIVTIFIALNFVAYFLHKFIGSKYSIITTGVLGGFISSTATAWYFSRLAGKSKEGGMTHVGAIIIASSIMFPRLLIWLVVINPGLLKNLWLPVVIFGLIGFGAGFYFTRKSLGDEDFEERSIGNPINLKDAGIFGVIYVIILLAVGFAEAQFGNQGVLLAAGISGLTDVDAITISMAEYSKGSITNNTAATAILIAAFANTLIKYAFCLIFGNSNMRRYASWGFIPIFVAGIAYIVYMLVFS